MDIELFRGDITVLDVDAIVNAANRSLLGGGGVDGAIHRAAGQGLLEECRALNGCNTGEAKITSGHALKARWVIHTVGPVWRKGKHDEVRLLKACYENSLKIAEDKKLGSLAFPNISTGVYGFPKELAAEVALSVIYAYKDLPSSIEKIIFAVFDDENYTIYKKLLTNKIVAK